ncbi:MAG: YbeD family protein [Gammaproteobacteria bacterium]
MSDQELLEFPCVITVKAMGRHDVELDLTVVEIIRRHVERIDEGAVAVRASGKGNYVSVSVSVHAESREQMDRIYQDLTDCEHVLMAL